MSETGPEEESDAARLLNTRGSSPYLLLCDHASSAIPPDYGDLGLPPDCLRQHIAVDIGAAEVVAALSSRLDASAVLATFSRLVIDPNRMLDDPTLIVTHSDGREIPGNRALSKTEIATRIARYHRPYQDAVGRQTARLTKAGRTPLLVSVHSFTPEMNGFRRPWQLGLLWNRDPRLKDILLRRLESAPGLIIGDNEPYSGRGAACTMERHGMDRGLPHVLIEIRQDLIDCEAGVRRWSDLLARALRDSLAEASSLGVQHF